MISKVMMSGMETKPPQLYQKYNFDIGEGKGRKLPQNFSVFFGTEIKATLEEIKAQFHGSAYHQIMRLGSTFSSKRQISMLAV